MNVKNWLFLLCSALLGTSACECGKGKDIPDVSAIPVQVTIKRFEQDLFKLDTLDMATGLASLESEYPEFSDIFFEKILGSKDSRIAPEGHEEYVRGFVTHPAIRHLYDTCTVMYPDLKKLQSELEQAFRFYKYHFPLEPLSGEVVTFISEYTVGGFLYGDNAVAIGLDFYLGENYPYVQYNPGNPNFSQYLTRTFNRDHIVMKTMKLLVDDLLGPPTGNRLVDHIVHNGKQLYILDQLLPYTPDSVKLEYSQKQVEWSVANESNIWAYFISENLLYSTDWGKFRKYVEPSPHSPGMPDDAPGRTGNWLGLQIVNAYMKKNPGTSLADLILLQDTQAILDKSKYKPAR